MKKKKLWQFSKDEKRAKRVQGKGYAYIMILKDSFRYPEMFIGEKYDG